MKWFFFLLMLAIVLALFRGFFFLLKDGGGSSKKVVQSLTIRVGLTVLFFGSLYISERLGWIEAHSLKGGLMQDLPAANAQSPGQ